MKFEQAFYTRGSDLLNEKGTGLGIAAASGTDYKFMQNCMSVGGQFNTERSKEKAEFLIYSERFGKFVGVGVSPAYNEDGGTINKLCHMYIPEEAAETPSDYFVNYCFRDQVKKGAILETEEKFPYLDTGNFPVFLSKYSLTEEKLAHFLYKLYPVALRERNLLQIVLDSEYSEEKIFETAREVAWILHCLVPATGEEAMQYRKNLSYAANSRDNISIVNLAFTTDESLFAENSISLKQFAVSEVKAADIPEVYKVLAQKAMQSHRDFEQMIETLQENRFDNVLSCRELELMYLQWKAGQNRKITYSQLPVSIDYITGEANKSARYRRFLYKLIPMLDQVYGEDTKMMWNRVIGPVIRAGLRNEYDLQSFDKAAVRVLRKMYEGLPGYYTLALKNMHHDVKKQYMTELFEETDSGVGEPISQRTDSVVQKHIKTISSVDECEEIFMIYDALHDHLEFMRAIAGIAETYYDEMSYEQRCNFTKKFEAFDDEFTEEYEGNLKIGWCSRIEKHIKELFENDENFKLIENEKGKVEKAHLSLYFEKIIEKIEEVEDAKWADLGEEFYKEYKNLLTNAVKEKYGNLKKQIEKIKIRKRLEQSEIEQLAEENFNDFPEGFSEELKEFWCQQVISRLQERAQEENPREKVKIKLELLEKLLGQYKVLNEFFALEQYDVLKEQYETCIWDSCGESFPKLLKCSLVFGIKRFSIWKAAKNVADFEKIGEAFSFHRLKQEERDKFFEELDKNSEEEFMRCSYNLWRDMVCRENLVLDVWRDFDLNQFAGKALELIEAFQGELRNKTASCWNASGRAALCINYLILGVKRDKIEKREIADYARCTALYEMKKSQDNFLEKILETEKIVDRECKNSERNKERLVIFKDVQTYIKRMKCYQMVQRYNTQGFLIDKAQRTLEEAKEFFGAEEQDFKVLEERIEMMSELNIYQEERKQLEIEKSSNQKRLACEKVMLQGVQDRIIELEERLCSARRDKETCEKNIQGYEQNIQNQTDKIEECNVKMKKLMEKLGISAEVIPKNEEEHLKKEYSNTPNSFSTRGPGEKTQNLTEQMETAGPAENKEPAFVKQLGGTEVLPTKGSDSKDKIMDRNKNLAAFLKRIGK